MASNQIDIIPSSKIDKVKWDACISRSKNNLIYPHSYYLDHMADNWHGIVINDYECIMPVPWRKKFGIRYCYDVPFIQQLGFFDTGDKNDTTILLDAFFSFIKYGDYNFNYYNEPITNITKVKTSTNFIIDLTNKENIENNFTKSFKQSLQNSSDHGLKYISTTPKEAIEMSRDLHKHAAKNISESDYKNLIQLTEILIPQDKCLARKVVNKTGETLSIVLLLKDEKRLYNIINATTTEGRNTEANYFLYAEVFKEFANKGLLFDFEGSELPGVKSFYKKMGAIDQPYYKMHINNLSFPLKLIKR